MAKQTLVNLRAYVDGYDLSGSVNAMALRYGADLIDVTTILETTRVRMGGLKTIALQLEGFYEAGVGLVDDVLFARLGVSDVPVTILTSPDVGATSYSFLAIAGEYTPIQAAAVGDAMTFSFSAEG